VGLSDTACEAAARGCGWSGVTTCSQLQSASASGQPPCPADVASGSIGPVSESGWVWWVSVGYACVVCVWLLCVVLEERSRCGRVLSVK
jgi:hypothetical protein